MPDPNTELTPDQGAVPPEMTAGEPQAQDTMTPGCPPPSAGDATVTAPAVGVPATAGMTPTPPDGAEATDPAAPAGPMPAYLMPSAYLVQTSVGVIEVDPGTLEHHRFAASLPLMRPRERQGLRDAIQLNGQQVPAVLFNGKLLDGRNRAGVCIELGIPLRVVEYTGSEAHALMYVIDANQHHRDLSKSQRAAVAATLIPVLAENVAVERIEKIRSARLAALGREIRINLSQSPSSPEPAVRARVLAAQAMGVSEAYVQWALRVQRERPDLFEQVWNGTLSLPAAMAAMKPAADVQMRKQVASTRGRVISWLRRAPERPDFLAALTELLDRFDADGPGETAA